MHRSHVLLSALLLLGISVAAAQDCDRLGGAHLGPDPRDAGVEQRLHGSYAGRADDHRSFGLERRLHDPTGWRGADLGQTGLGRGLRGAAGRRASHVYPTGLERWLHGGQGRWRPGRISSRVGTAV